MVVEQFPSFFDWLFPDFPSHAGALITSILIAFALGMAGLFCGYLASAMRHGPTEGFYVVARVVASAVPDLVQTSPRRTWAIARLAIQESIRRRVLLTAFGLFALAMLVGGWFLDVESEHPDQLYISSVMFGTLLLALMLVILLSAFSLPNDIKNRTIYTVITKPVRAGEIVLGRILGFSIIGTMLLGIMCLVSYLFVIRGLDHRHAVAAESLIDVQSPSTEMAAGGSAATVPSRRREGRTTKNSHHRHKVIVDEGIATMEPAMGHTHSITMTGEGDNATFKIGGPQGMLQARVPVYGKLRFLDRTGKTRERGVNVGNEWEYRSYILGGTLAAAIWEIEGVTPDMMLDDQLPLEITLSVFRTYKGNIEEGVKGELVLKHPSKSIQTTPRVFVTREFENHRINVSRKLKGQDREGKLLDIDLFDDLVDDQGRIEIRIRCVDPGQYLGMAQADVYVRAKDNWFITNFFKGFFSIWLQMIIVVCIGVTFSTFLNAAVSLLATVAVTAVSYFTKFISALVSGELWGGGPLEASIRIVTQKNLKIDLEPTIGTAIIQKLDAVILWFMKLVTYAVPDFVSFYTADYVAYGFKISDDLLATHVVITLGFVIGLTVIAYFFLKTREIAA